MRAGFNAITDATKNRAACADGSLAWGRFILKGGATGRLTVLSWLHKVFYVYSCIPAKRDEQKYAYKTYLPQLITSPNPSQAAGIFLSAEVLTL